MDLTEPKNCTCFNLRRAARAVTQLYDEALKPTGLRATQMPILAMLDAIGSVPMTQLANALGMDRTTLTRNLRPLLAQKLVATTEGADKRQRRVEITAQGRRRLTDAEPHWRAVQTRLAESFGIPEWQNLMGGLDNLVAEIHD
ncbi:MAG: winged helix-turn-helix transcriptional regulator [Rhodospirillaceae bacterium]|nr:winged helix-turn-helix transcriptional regulator [Rhodospirillaceae bacterium]MBT5297555.1 winged helix-turn-helix transcriptional regulator [Rhodospirillaceae bacterium]MBT6086745.1 winged helix-turn-helix transcriptional regulator [Rhodospirillaceae bacterium]MBT6607944.1 winged helix-turn-helix transcriptional regulator [Rhodospirillaceae bacterium]MBT6885368.1 winged helix-turn-helix transcriptional regulator [Rhodospirillaceae bacterium]